MNRDNYIKIRLNFISIESLCKSKILEKIKKR